jgi:hypothetical protein
MQGSKRGRGSLTMRTERIEMEMVRVSISSAVMWGENVCEKREMKGRISFNESWLIMIFILRYIVWNIEIF